MLIYADVDGQLKRIASVAGFSESVVNIVWDWPAWGHESIYQFKPGKNPEYNDLYVYTMGDCGGLMFQLPTCGRRVYTFNGLEYVLVSEPATPTPFPSDAPVMAPIPSETPTVPRN